MDSSATCSLPVAAAAEACQPLSDAGWQTLHDAARGTRHLRTDAQGRPRTCVPADGASLHFAHDPDGSLRRIESGDWFVRIEALPRGPTMALHDPSGCTELHLSRGGRTRRIRRATDELSIELDALERPTRVRLPGSRNALVYEWDEDGGAIIRAAGGPALLTLSGVGGARRIALSRNVFWDETLLPGQVILRAVADDATRDVTLDVAQLSRITARRWSDGSSDSFSTDASGRLSAWLRGDASGETETRWRYEGQHLVEDASGTRTLDAGGRVLRLDRADGSVVHYRYDANGRRIARETAGGVAEYAYDPLGALIRVSLPDGTVSDRAFDGMGRRLSCGELHEHRDESGRLWCVTGPDGRTLHAFIWIGDRIAARIDGPIGEPVAEAYATDPFGTPLLTLSPQGETWRVRRCDAPPFGTAAQAHRPGLYGHFADPAAGLIHFGAREYDPELGLFLTPDPWHGGADDPRRWGGADDAVLRRMQEFPGAGFHDYALSRFDPLGRSDRDGHVSAGDVILHIVRWVLLPTWGFPLTSISLFLFEPLNLYMEVIGLIVWAIKGIFCDDKSHPWKYHTIVKATGLLGSVRQFTFAFGLNGFLPRVISGGGPGGDRAVTVGNVIWINREELALLGRPEIVEVLDIGGRAGLQKLNDDPAKTSVLALLGSDSDGKQRIHCSTWTRGFGNAVRDRPATGGGAGVPSFADVSPGGGNAPGTLVLRQPIPFAVSVPASAGDREKLEVREFTRVGTDPALDLESQSQVWFALKLPADTSFATDDWVRIIAPGAPDPKPDPVFLRIRSVLPADDHAALILSAELPARLRTGTLAQDLRIDKVIPTAGATASAPWTATGTPPTTLTYTPAGTPPAAPPDLAADGLVQIVAATGAPAPALAGIAAGPAETTTFAAIKVLRVVMTLGPDAAGAVSGNTLFRRQPDGDAFQGTIEHAAERGAIKLAAAAPSISQNDLLVVTHGAGDPAYVRATASPTSNVLPIDPPLPADFAPADGAAVNLQKTKDTDSDDKAAVTAVSGADVTVTPPHGSLFARDNLVRVDPGGGGTQALRRITAIARMEVDIADPPIGTGDLTLTPANLVADRVRKGVELAPPGRFLKWTGAGAAPGTLGQWDGAILGLQFSGLGWNPFLLETSAFYVRWPGDTKPAGFHRDFHRSWSLATSGTDQYVVLETPLPIVRHKDYQGNMKSWWRVDMDDYSGERDFILDPFPATLAVHGMQFTRSGAIRQDSDGARVLAHEPELLVPEDPTTHDQHRRALIEHEIHHTVQCNYWGPLMTALPIPGLIMSVTDIVGAAGGTIPGWMQQVQVDANGNPPATADGRIDHNTQLNPFQVASIGGMMQLAWKYVLLAPLLANDSARHDILDLDFNDFNKVFNPLSRLITERLPQVDPHAPAGTRWLDFLAQVLSRGLDLRSWTPFLGFVPMLLPDGAHNFIEQGASRASGDLYSTILSANDRFNLEAKTRFGGSFRTTDADLHPGIGRIMRLLLFCHYRTERVLQAAGADIPGSPMVYRRYYHLDPLFKIEPTDAAQPALVDTRLYEVTPAPAAGDLLTLEGPAPASTNAVFARVAPGATIAPAIRALVPMPPRVNRTAGFYMVAAAPGPLKITGFYSEAGDPTNDASTHVVTLTVEDDVTLDEASVAWAMPAVVGAAPTGTVNRFQTEQPVLKLRYRKKLKAGPWEDQGNAGFLLQSAEPRVAPTERADRVGWTIPIPNADPPGAPVRIRLFRLIAKDDPQFDLQFDDVPTLAGIRSYLDGITGDVFTVVRDFLLTVDRLPDLTDQTRNWNQSFDLALPIKLSQQARGITATPPAGVAAPPVSRKGDGPNRGETWTIGPLARQPAADAVVTVRVTYGAPGSTVDRTFRLTFAKGA